MKRHRPSPTIENPFVKPENRSWELTLPASLQRSVSPPTTRRKSQAPRPTESTDLTPVKSITAAVEAGEVEIEDHVSFFSTKLFAARQPQNVEQPRLSHQAWLNLYQRNLNNRGHHFVVHQHDHPVAGTHYDLRLQCNATSSISFAIPKGLPGDPNSRQVGRNAVETRVHNLWNHLIETASHDTGTMLLWDTGEYQVIPFKSTHLAGSNVDTDGSGSDSDADTLKESEPQELHRAFQQRKIKLRLHGTRLPENYTINLRLTDENHRVTQPVQPSYKRRRNNSTIARKRQIETSDSSQPSSQDTLNPSSVDWRPPQLKQSVSSLHRLASPPAPKRSAADNDAGLSSSSTNHSATPDPASTSDEQIRLQNTYPGATNSINSIHQRKWFLSLDRRASGLTPSKDPKSGRQVWHGDFRKFHVLGREHETSVLTGRKGAEVARDEGLVSYRPRGGWVGITD